MNVLRERRASVVLLFVERPLGLLVVAVGVALRGGVLVCVVAVVCALVLSSVLPPTDTRAEPFFFSQ